MADRTHFMDRPGVQRAPEHTYRPLPIPPRGLRLAWGLAALMTVYGAAVIVLGRGISPLALALTFLMAILALLMTYGNWVEARTSISVGPSAIRYDSGVRHAEIRWEAVREMQVRPRRAGYSVEVIGQAGHFRFHTQAPIGLRMRDGSEPLTGFPDGEHIARTIAERASLTLAHASPGGRLYRRGVLGSGHG